MMHQISVLSSSVLSYGATNVYLDKIVRQDLALTELAIYEMEEIEPGERVQLALESTRLRLTPQFNKVAFLRSPSELYTLQTETKVNVRTNLINAAYWLMLMMSLAWLAKRAAYAEKFKDTAGLALRPIIERPFAVFVLLFLAKCSLYF